METYKRALSRASSTAYSNAPSEPDIHSLHISKHLPMTPWTASIRQLVTSTSDAKATPPPVLESARIHIRRMKYTFSFYSHNPCAWKVADHTTNGSFHTALRIRSHSKPSSRPSPSRPDINFTDYQHACIDMMLREKLHGLQVPANESDEEEKWKGPWVLHCRLERYALDFQFLVWKGDRERTVLKYFYTGVCAVERILWEMEDEVKEKWDFDKAIERLVQLQLQWQPV